MFWADDLATSAAGRQVVNDSKTPSGTVHVGSLRGPVVVDTLARALRNAAVIEKTNGDAVSLGSKVVIKGMDGEETFTIVGAAEAAPREGRISNESPVGAALMGRRKGEKVTVNAPSGPIEYTLVRIG